MNRLKSNLKRTLTFSSRGCLLLYELYLAGRVTIGACEKVFQRDTQLVGAGGQRWRAIISSYEPRETAPRISSPWLYRKPPLYHLSFIKPTLCSCLSPQWGPTSKRSLVICVRFLKMSLLPFAIKPTLLQNKRAAGLF